MKYTNNDEPPIHTLLAALIVTILAILIWLIPAPPAEAPAVDLIDIPPRAEAMEVSVLKPKTDTPSLRTALVPVCSCESTWSPDNDPMLYHYEEDGVTPLIGRYHSADRGMCQINMAAHSETIKEMGLDILSDVDDYITFSNWLYDTQGLTPWEPSRSCWDINNRV